MFLGIDMGTSKVAAVVADPSGAVLAAASEPHAADLAAPAGHSEQDAEAMVATAVRLVAGLPAALRRGVAGIGVTGQVHGFCFVGDDGRAVSPQVTWQDQRCEQSEQAPGLLARLRDRTGYRLSTGFAPATMTWMLERGGFPTGASAACNICDLVVQRLCGLKRPVTDTTQAASWGFFNLRWLSWDEAAITASGLPRGFFPQVLPCGAQAGTLAEVQARALGLKAGIPVAAALGDNQASLVSSLTEPASQVLLTLGTGGQVSAVLPPGAEIDLAAPATSYEYRPHIAGLYAAVSASLCGGSAWKWLAELCASWAADLACKARPLPAIYERLNELGAAAAAGGAERTGLVVHPSFLAERHEPLLRGRIEGIDPRNMGLGALAWATARGIVANLRDMMPAWSLQGRAAVVGTGNALRRNPLLRDAAAAVFGLPLRLPAGSEEAAAGAAAVAARLA
jgi:sedoheptulokinase